MTRQEIEQKVNKFLVDEFKIDEEKIKSVAILKNDLNIDSLDVVDLGVGVKKVFGFKIQLEEMKAVKTLNDFYDYIERKLAQQ